MRSRVVEAYLGHRLNHSELVALAQDGSPEIEDRFAHFTARTVDERPEFSTEQLGHAWDQLGLKTRYENLQEDAVWSAEDRALHRRLSQPEHDPSSAPVADPATALSPRLLALAEESFSAWDRDNNIRLDKQELDYIIAGGFSGEKLEQSNDPEKAAVLATMLRYNDLLSAGSPFDGNGVSLADLKAWSASPELIKSGAMALVNEVYEEYRERAHQMVDGQRPLAEETISGKEIRQGVVGSCVMLSTVAGTSDAKLGAMFADNGDGTHLVTFPDGATEQVYEPSVAARLHHTQGRDGERWPAILEIAAAQRLTGEGVRSEHGLRGTIEGIDPGFALPAFTARPTDQRSIDELSLAETGRLLEQASASGSPILCGSRPAAQGDFINVEELHNGIANSHCYSVQGYDPESRTVQMQNPWHKGEWIGANDGANDGRFEMPLKDFYSSFRWVAFAADSAAA